MTAHFCYGPVTLFKIMLNATGGAAGNGIFQQGMVRNDRKTIVFSVTLPTKRVRNGSISSSGSADSRSFRYE
jgi:hypothetical protein